MSKRIKCISINVLSLLSILILYGCPSELNYFPTILEELEAGYIQLPEKAISTSQDNSVFAQYTNPTSKYSHGILGDQIEAEQLVVVVDSVFYELELDEDFVFEDLRPRLYDVDQDGELEFITIKANISLGAGIAIYKIIDNQLTEYAYVSEIGTSNKWLNIVAINDLDQDGIIELAWIETPHIGGILKVAKINQGEMIPLDEISGYSNHAIGERNLCLSSISLVENRKIIHVPNQDRNRIIDFSFENSKLQFQNEIEFNVDFAKTLSSQYNFMNEIEEGEDNCIFVE